MRFESWLWFVKKEAIIRKLNEKRVKRSYEEIRKVKNENESKRNEFKFKNRSSWLNRSSWQIIN